MRWRLLAGFLAITVGLGLVQVLTPRVVTGRSKVTATVSSIICPDSASGASVALAGSGIRFSPIGKLPKGIKDLPFTTSKEITTAKISSAAHIAEKSVGGITQIDNSSGLAGLSCPSEDTSYWFVGGSAALTSADRLILSNAGHGDAAATVSAWGSKGPIPTYPVVVPAQSTIRVGLDSIAPGMNSIVLHVLVRSGRIAASLYDQRVQGLTDLGADFVPAGMDPARKFIVLGVPGTPSSSKNKAKKPLAQTRILRLLSPMNDSSVRVDVIGAGDSFTPLGLDSIELKAGVVTDIPVTASLPSAAYAFAVTSDLPVVAGVFSTINAAKGSDIAWTASSPALVGDSISADFGGTTYFFYSHADTSVEITATLAGSAPMTSTLAVPAESVIAWAPAKSTNGPDSIRLRISSGVVYAARMLTTSDGLTTSPLRPMSVGRRSTAPIADVGVGMPR